MIAAEKLTSKKWKFSSSTEKTNIRERKILTLDMLTGWKVKHSVVATSGADLPSIRLPRLHLVCRFLPGQTHLIFSTLRLLFEDFLQKTDIQSRLVTLGPQAPFAGMFFEQG
jgi:hypothetical protein